MRLITTTRSVVRLVVVMAGIIALTSISIDATDSFRTSQSALGIFARAVTEKKCAEGTVTLQIDSTTLCVDVFEASVGSKCVITDPKSEIDTAANANDPDCVPISDEGVLPWRFVSEIQAEQLCARAGKRLLTSLEWYTAARGTPDGLSLCVLNSNLQKTGSKPECRSGIGAHDMIGNVWELVSDPVINTNVGSHSLPSSGYVNEVASDGLARITSDEANVIYNKDYFWSEATGTFAIMRGGYYGSGEDGGLYSAHADIKQNFNGVALGFRCISTL